MEPTKVVREAPRDRDADAILDNGRRGDPLPGCDCVQCFGMCMVDREVAERAGFDASQDRV